MRLPTSSTPRRRLPLLSPALFFLLLVNLLAGLMPASADTAPASVTLADLLKIVRDKSPRFAVILQRIEAARAEVVAAGVLPNPTVSYGRFDLVGGGRNTMFDGNSQEQVTLEMPLLIAGQRGARIEAAEKGVLAAEADVEAEYAALIHETRRLFVELLANQERVAVLEETALEMRRLTTIVGGRKEAGNASAYDALRIGVEASGIETRLETARSDQAQSAGDLALLLGLPDWKPAAAGKLAVLGVPADTQKLLSEAELSNPDIIAAQRSETAAEAGLEKAKRERWPGVSVQVGTVYTDSPYSNTTFAGVSVEVPIFDRNQGGMARAEAAKQTAKLEHDYASSRIRVAIERAVGLLVRRQKTRLKFEKDVLSKLPNLKSMGESAYRLGKGTILELLDSYRSRTEMRLTEVDLLQAETEAELDALGASGQLLNYLDDAAAGVSRSGVRKQLIYGSGKNSQ
jgi:cobalt-zinc-cadmium efflux system outer membrane protein